MTHKQWPEFAGELLSSFRLFDVSLHWLAG
jgi:hypothetical protein